MSSRASTSLSQGLTPKELQPGDKRRSEQEAWKTQTTHHDMSLAE